MIRRYTFPGVSSYVLLAVALHCTWSLTQLLWCFIWRTVGSSGTEDLMAKTLLLASSRPSDRPTLPLTKALVHPVLLNISWRVSVLIQTGRRIDRRSNQPDRQFIRCYCLLLLCFLQSSDACRNWTVGSSDSASCLKPSRSVPSAPTHTSTLVPRYHRFIWRCLFFFFLSSVLTLKRLCLDSNQTPGRLTVSSLRLSDHPVLLFSAALLLPIALRIDRRIIRRCQFSWPSVQCTKYTDAHI
jgi:hypothetical protein